jgi:hypothetical protein
MLENQGFRPKSELSAQEREAFVAYREECLALPPANSNESAKAHRSFWVKHHPQLQKTLDELKLDY